MLDPEFTIIGMSDAYARATMVTREQIMGKNVFVAFPENPDDPIANSIKNVRASLETALKNKKPDTMAVQKYDIRRPLTEGGGYEERYWSLINWPLLTDDNQVKYIIIHVTDVTEFVLLKKTGVEQQQLMDELRTQAGEMEIEIYRRAQEIQKVNKKLQHANETLEKLNQLQTQFFANVSHELRTPLMLILGPLETLLQEHTLQPKILHKLHLIEKNARILLKHVNDLLDVAKLNAGKMPIYYAQVDLTTVIRETAALFEERIQERQICFVLDIPEHVPAQIDREKIQRVLMNLLSNAVKFTPPKGHIKLTLTLHHSHARFSIEDTSPGIPPIFHEAIFERFFQTEESTTRHFGGTGLGLAIAKEYIELHGGSITVSNAPEGGAVFTAELPLKAPPGTTVKTDVENMPISEQESVQQLIKELNSQEMTTRKRHFNVSHHDDNSNLPLILVIEDNVDMNQFVCDILSNTYRTESAFDGEDGIEKALNLHPDIIVCDVMMPHKNGVQVVYEIRQHIKLLTTPIIILTAKANDALCVQMLREGAQDYMTKPFSPNEFKARIANLMNSKKADDELERFVYLASHDLKAPIPAMERLITWIEEDSSENLSDQSKQHLALLRGRAYRMSNLLDALLRYSQAGQIGTKVSIVNSKQLVEGIITELNAPPTFSFKCANNLPVLEAPQTLLHQVFSALIDNSIKHHTHKNGHVKIGMHEHPKFYEFFVEDDGPGIAPEYHSKIFQLFQTLQPRDTLESSGVGLSIAKKIVESQGGKITVRAAKNQGTVFSFTWPKRPATVQ